MRQRLTVSILGFSPHMQLDLKRLSHALERLPGVEAFALNPQTEMVFLVVNDAFNPLELESAFIASGLKAQWPRQTMSFGQPLLERIVPVR